MEYKPLKGIKVVELGTHVAVPAATRIMADWGADIVKVEPLRGEPWRYIGAVVGVPFSEEENPLFLVSNSNKRGISLNLKTDEGKQVLEKLISEADVFISNTRTLALDKLGLGYERLSEKYPKLIYAHFTGFGEIGPDANRPGFDNAAFWARSGALIDWSSKGSFPLKPGLAVGDNTVATMLLSGILGALVGREKTGKGEKVSTSLYASSIWYNNAAIIASQDTYGVEIVNDEMNPPTPLSHYYKCKDGGMIMVTVIEYDKYFPLLCKLLGTDEIADKYKTLRDANKNMPELISILNDAFLKKDRDEWAKLFNENEIVYENLVRSKDISKDDQAWQNNFLCEYEYENGRKAVFPRTPVKFGKEKLPEYNASPKLGEHTREILAEIGYEENEIIQMVQNKTVMASK